MPKTYSREDVVLFVYSIVENSSAEFFDELDGGLSYETVCDWMNLDAETTAYVLSEISRDLACA